MAQQNLGMGQIPGQMQNDWSSYFSSAQPGQTTNWGGGTLTMGQDGQAQYKAQNATNGGTVINPNSISNPAYLQSLAASNPGIAQQWGEQYGYNSGVNPQDQAVFNRGIAQTSPAGQQGQNPYMTSQPQQQTQPAQSGLGQNPWLQQQGQALQAMSNQNLQQNVLPGIGQGAQAAGMYGSSRQGVAEGQAMGNAQNGLNAALANMYSQAYGQDQNYNLGMGNLALNNKQANNSYDLGLRNSDLGFGQLDANINQQNFNNNLAGANFGMGVYGMMNGMNQQGINSGTQMQNTPLNYFNQFNGNTNATGGMGGTQTGTQGTTSNGLSQGLGLGLAGGDLLTKYFTAV